MGLSRDFELILNNNLPNGTNIGITVNYTFVVGCLFGKSNRLTFDLEFDGNSIMERPITVTNDDYNVSKNNGNSNYNNPYTTFCSSESSSTDFESDSSGDNDTADDVDFWANLSFSNTNYIVYDDLISYEHSIDSNDSENMHPNQTHYNYFTIIFDCEQSDPRDTNDFWGVHSVSIEIKSVEIIPKYQQRVRNEAFSLDTFMDAVAGQPWYVFFVFIFVWT